MALDSLRRRANARNVSFRISLRWLTYIVNSVDKTKLALILSSLRDGRRAQFDEWGRTTTKLG